MVKEVFVFVRLAIKIFKNALFVDWNFFTGYTKRKIKLGVVLMESNFKVEHLI